ncbi:uncharacterized protein METZ01_LOCUS105753, partial [marine metagenome]
MPQENALLFNRFDDLASSLCDAQRVRMGQLNAKSIALSDSCLV